MTTIDNTTTELDINNAMRDAFQAADVRFWTDGTLSPEEDHMTPEYPETPDDWTHENDSNPYTPSAILSAINGIFEPTETRSVLSKTAAGLLKSAVRSWTWWELRLRQAESVAQRVAAEAGQKRNASLAAALLPLIARRDVPSITTEIVLELDRDPNRGLDTEDRLMRTAENTGQDINKLRARMHELQAGKALDIDPKEKAIRAMLKESHLPNLANRFVHDVEAEGARDLNWDELEILTDRCIGRLVGDKQRGYQGMLVQAELGYMRAASATLQRQKYGTLLLLQKANQELEAVMHTIGQQKLEQSAEGYEPTTRGMLIMR